jgi:hypothetical protein
LTSRQTDVPKKIVQRIFGVAFFLLLIVLARGYYTLLLILIGVMFGIGAFTFTYDRSTTLNGLASTIAIGLLSLLMQGYQTLFLVIVLTI